MGRPILYDATAVRLTSRSGGADDNFLDFEDGRNAPVSNAGEARMRLGAAGIEHSYNGGAYQGLGGFDRIHYLANTATEADVQAALNDPRYDIVALEAGAWANPFAANLTIPAGKLLVGFSWTGDADDLPTLTFTGTAQILMNGSRMESLKLIHLNTRTAGLVVGSGDGAWIERVFIQTSDGNFYNYWAVSGVVRRMEDCGVNGLKGVSPDSPADYELGRPIIRNVYCNGVSNANSIGISLGPTADRFLVDGAFLVSCNIGLLLNNVDDVDFYAIWTTDPVVDGIQITNVCNRIHGSKGRNNGGATAFTIGQCWNSSFSDFTSRATTGYGIDIGNNAASTFSNFSTQSHTNVGIRIDTNDGCTFTGFSATDGITGSSGFSFDANTFCSFTAFVAENNRGTVSSHGFYISRGTDCNFSNFVARLNQGSGFHSAGNNLTRCHFSGLKSRDNDVRGLHIYTGAGTQQECKWDDLVVTGNGTEGIFVNGVNECTFSNVRVQDNGADGFDVGASSTKCLFENIEAVDNGGWGFLGGNVATFANRNTLRNIRSYSNTGGEISVGTNWVTGKPHGALFVSTPAATTTIAAYPTMYKMAGTTTLSGEEEEFDDNAVSNRLRYLGDAQKLYRVTATVSLQVNTPAIDVYVGLWRSGVIVPGSVSRFHVLTAGIHRTVTAQFLVRLSLNQYVEIAIGSSSAGAQVSADLAQLVVDQADGY